MSVAVETPLQKLGQIEAEIRKANQEHRQFVDAKTEEIRKLLGEIAPTYGIKPETKAAPAETRAMPQKNGAHKQRKATASGRKAQVVKPKYRDPQNQSNTWAGRGLPPRWLKDYEKAGRSRDEFRV